MSNYDNVVPKEKWEFDSSVADCFENMLERSIPDYFHMRELVVDMCDSLILQNKKTFSLLDLGCSDGLNVVRFVDKYGAHGKYTLVDCSEPMLAKCRERYANLENLGIVNILNMDLRKDFPRNFYDVITSILCIMFVPIQYRQVIIQNIYDSLNSGGVFIFVEKVLGNSARIDTSLVDNYYKMKHDNGYSYEQIERKKLSLEGVQVPVTSNWNVDLLKQAGFRQIDVFWRYLNFVGYVAIK